MQFYLRDLEPGCYNFMKLLDRHVLKQVLVPIIYCLLTFSMLFVVFDLFEHLSDFIQSQVSPLAVILYYLSVLPALSVYIAPISLLLGLLYGLWQMSRHNEIIAMRASGVSLWRLATPLLCIGVAASLLVLALQEFVSPSSSYWAAQFITRIENEEDLSMSMVFNLPYKNDRDHRIWAIRQFDLTTYEMQGVNLIQQREDDSDVSNINAQRAAYYDQRWWFFDVVLQRYDLFGRRLGPPEEVPLMDMRELTETPHDFANEEKDPMFLPAQELWQYIAKRPKLSGKTKNRYLVDLHARLAMPWTCLVVILFGLPFGVQTARQGAFMGVIWALVTFFIFYLIMMLGQWMGKEQIILPFLGAWLPNVVFLFLGLLFMKRIR